MFNAKMLRSKDLTSSPKGLQNRLSYKEHTMDALASGADEGRDKLR